MDEQSALLRATLRYCVYAVQELRDREYSGRSYGALFLTDPPNDPGWREIRARQGILYDIQVAIESLSADSFPTLDDLRAHLVELGRSTPLDWGNHVLIEVEERAVAEERERFCAYVQGLTANDLQSVGPVPTERDLTPRERERVWARLSKRWGVERNEVWYPLQSAATPPPPNSLAVESAWFAWDVPLAALRGILKSRKVRHVWEIMNSPSGHAKELDLALFIPYYGETVWTSEKMDWMIYASHESSLTFCGDWLVNLVKQAWPAWERHPYTGYDYERPPYGESDLPAVQDAGTPSRRHHQREGPA